MTDAQLLTMVGKALFPGADWPSRVGTAFDLSKNVVRDIRRGHTDLHRDVAEKMLLMVEERLGDLGDCRDRLRDYLAR